MCSLGSGSPYTMGVVAYRQDRTLSRNSGLVIAGPVHYRSLAAAVVRSRVLPGSAATLPRSRDCIGQLLAALARGDDCTSQTHGHGTALTERFVGIAGPAVADPSKRITVFVSTRPGPGQVTPALGHKKRSGHERQHTTRGNEERKARGGHTQETGRPTKGETGCAMGGNTPPGECVSYL